MKFTRNCRKQQISAYFFPRYLVFEANPTDAFMAFEHTTEKSPIEAIYKEIGQRLSEFLNNPETRQLGIKLHLDAKSKSEENFFKLFDEFKRKNPGRIPTAQQFDGMIYRASQDAVDVTLKANEAKIKAFRAAKLRRIVEGSPAPVSAPKPAPVPKSASAAPASTQSVEAGFETAAKAANPEYSIASVLSKAEASGLNQRTAQKVAEYVQKAVKQYGFKGDLNTMVSEVIAAVKKNGKLPKPERLERVMEKAVQNFIEDASMSTDRFTKKYDFSSPEDPRQVMRRELQALGPNKGQFARQVAAQPKATAAAPAPAPKLAPAASASTPPAAPADSPPTLRNPGATESGKVKVRGVKPGEAAPNVPVESPKPRPMSVQFRFAAHQAETAQNAFIPFLEQRGVPANKLQLIKGKLFVKFQAAAEAGIDMSQIRQAEVNKLVDSVVEEVTGRTLRDYQAMAAAAEDAGISVRGKPKAPASTPKPAVPAPEPGHATLPKSAAAAEPIPTAVHTGAKIGPAAKAPQIHVEDDLPFAEPITKPKSSPKPAPKPGLVSPPPDPKGGGVTDFSYSTEAQLPKGSSSKMPSAEPKVVVREGAVVLDQASVEAKVTKARMMTKEAETLNAQAKAAANAEQVASNMGRPYSKAEREVVNGLHQKAFEAEKAAEAARKEAKAALASTPKPSTGPSSREVPTVRKPAGVIEAASLEEKAAAAEKLSQEAYTLRIKGQKMLKAATTDAEKAVAERVITEAEALNRRATQATAEVSRLRTTATVAPIGAAEKAEAQVAARKAGAEIVKAIQAGDTAKAEGILARIKQIGKIDIGAAVSGAARKAGAAIIDTGAAKWTATAATEFAKEFGKYIADAGVIIRRVPGGKVVLEKGAQTLTFLKVFGSCSLKAVGNIMWAYEAAKFGVERASEQYADLVAGLEADYDHEQHTDRFPSAAEIVSALYNKDLGEQDKAVKQVVSQTVDRVKGLSAAGHQIAGTGDRALDQAAAMGMRRSQKIMDEKDPNKKAAMRRGEDLGYLLASLSQYKPTEVRTESESYDPNRYDDSTTWNLTKSAAKFAFDKAWDLGGRIATEEIDGKLRQIQQIEDLKQRQQQLQDNINKAESEMYFMRAEPGFNKDNPPPLYTAYAKFVQLTKRVMSSDKYDSNDPEMKKLMQEIQEARKKSKKDTEAQTVAKKSTEVERPFVKIDSGMLGTIIKLNEKYAYNNLDKPFKDKDGSSYTWRLDKTAEKVVVTVTPPNDSNYKSAETSFPIKSKEQIANIRAEKENAAKKPSEKQKGQAKEGQVGT